MPSEVKRVVILYAHPLLGEGIGRILTAQPDLRVELVSLDDECGADTALSTGPDVVILERTTPLRALDYLRSAPGALFIDVGLDTGPSWTYRRDAIDPKPDELVRAIHASRTMQDPGSEAALVGAGPSPLRRGAARRRASVP